MVPEEEIMTSYRILAVAAFIMILGGSAVAAEVDLSKLTCKQAAEVGQFMPTVVAAWASGYADAKSNNTMVDLGKLRANLGKVKNACAKTPDATVASLISRRP